MLLILNIFLLTGCKLICGEYKLWAQPPKNFVRLITALAKMKNYKWSSVCSNIASFRTATLLTMKFFMRLSQGLINFKIPHHLSVIGGTLYSAERFLMTASKIRRKSLGLSTSTIIQVLYTFSYISVWFLKMYVYIFVEHFLEDKNQRKNFQTYCLNSH